VSTYRRVDSKVRHITEQIEVLERAVSHLGEHALDPSISVNNAPMHTLGEALELQRWRLAFLQQCAGWPEGRLRERLHEIERTLGMLWEARYQLDLKSLDQQKRQMVMEMYLIEVVLGTAPGVS